MLLDDKNMSVSGFCFDLIKRPLQMQTRAISYQWKHYYVFRCKPRLVPHQDEPLGDFETGLRLYK